MKTASRLIAGVGRPLLPLLEQMDRRRDRLRVLTYHRVDWPEARPWLFPGLISATPATFEAHLELLRARYNVLSLDAFLAAERGEEPLPPRAVLLTFDDAYEDFAEHAWPLLKAYGLPAVMFVPTAFPDTADPFWWDRLWHVLSANDVERLPAVQGIDESLSLRSPGQRLRAYKLLRNRFKTLAHDAALAWLEDATSALEQPPASNDVLSWAQLETLAAEGLAVCPHSHRHALLPREPEDAIRADLEEAQRVIRFRVAGSHAEVMAYPSNAVDRRSADIVEAMGYRYAFAGERRAAKLPVADRFAIGRLPVSYGNDWMFRAQLQPTIAALGATLTELRGGKGKSAAAAGGGAASAASTR